MARGDINPKTKFKRAVYGNGIYQYCFVSFLLKVQSLHENASLLAFLVCNCLKSIASIWNCRILQDIGKAYNELKQGEPAIERLFNLTLFKSQVDSYGPVDFLIVRSVITNLIRLIRKFPIFPVGALALTQRISITASRIYLTHYFMCFWEFFDVSK